MVFLRLDDGGSESEHSSKTSTVKKERQNPSVNVTMKCGNFRKLDNLTPRLLFDHSEQFNIIWPTLVALFALVALVGSVLDPLRCMPHCDVDVTAEKIAQEKQAVLEQRDEQIRLEQLDLLAAEKKAQAEKNMKREMARQIEAEQIRADYQVRLSVCVSVCVSVCESM